MVLQTVIPQMQMQNTEKVMQIQVPIVMPYDAAQCESRFADAWPSSFAAVA